MRKRILSGIQPSGSLHLGNYFGMMRSAIELQERGEAFYFIANYHALTTLHDPAQLRENSHFIALDFLSCGLDPEKACLFRQSDIPEVAELAWILSTVTPMGLLERCHSYKDKLARGISPSHGLFAYPVLMAADILIYDSDIVPVGKDQKQHVEVTRDIAGKFNECYGPVFKLPEVSIQENTAAVPGLDGQKMSKSYHNTLELFPEEKALRKAIMGIKTDSSPVDAQKNPDDSVIFAIYQLVAKEEQTKQMRQEFLNGGVGYGDFKKRLFNALWAYFEPMRQRREEILGQKGYIDDVLEQGAKRAHCIASTVMDRVRNAVGL